MSPYESYMNTAIKTIPKPSILSSLCYLIGKSILCDLPRLEWYSTCGGGTSNSNSSIFCRIRTWFYCITSKLRKFPIETPNPRLIQEKTMTKFPSSEMILRGRWIVGRATICGVFIYPMWPTSKISLARRDIFSIRTASFIMECSFSAKISLQNWFTAFIRHTATGYPRKERTLMMKEDFIHMEIANGDGLHFGGT